jgi:N-glycosylase/DNA lyase
VSTRLPEPWLSVYLERRADILARLEDFSRVPSEEYFYELAFCILTPQSSARNADKTIEELKRDRFLDRGFDPTPYLRDPSHYIRFHNVKSARLLKIRGFFPELLPLLQDRTLPPIEQREKVIEKIQGFGLKEASHFLRNIGVRGLAILDRHILKHLEKLAVIEEIPPNAPTRKRYLEIEQAWINYSTKVGISIDELDLLFWSMETGEIRK